MHVKYKEKIYGGRVEATKNYCAEKLQTMLEEKQ
jgi:hypothetical protein